MVVNVPVGAADFDRASAPITGQQEADGVLWFEHHQLFGTVNR